MKRFLWDDSGATAMEYGLILGLAALVVFVGISIFYQELANLFSDWGGWFANPTTQGPRG